MDKCIKLGLYKNYTSWDSACIQINDIIIKKKHNLDELLLILERQKIDLSPICRVLLSDD